MTLASATRTLEKALSRAVKMPPAPPANFATAGLLDFVPMLTPSYMRPTHLAPIAEQLERSATESVGAVFSAPPRHGKTELVLSWIAWLLKRRPEYTIGFATYGADLAHSKSRMAREYTVRAGVALRTDSSSVSEWRTTAGGGVLAAGVGGPWTGYGLNVLVVDDPFKDRQDADSPLIRARTREWYQSTALTRLEPGGSKFVLGARWHERDLSGWLLTPGEDHGEYESINLPALDGHGRSLWPERWSAEALLAKKREVGPFEWSSLYLGAPTARGGEVFRGAPARYTSVDLHGARLVIGCDPAGTTAETSDYTAIVVLACRGYGANLTADVIECDRFRLEPAAAAPRLAALKTRYPGASVFIESSRDGKAIVRALQTIDSGLRFKEVPPHASKLMRAGPVAGAWAEGRLRLPMTAPWLDDYLHEIQRFTGVGDAHDDFVDATSLAWNSAATTGDFAHKFMRAMASV